MAATRKKQPYAGPPKTVEELTKVYRMPSNALNWNRLVYYEWNTQKGIWRNRDTLLAALLPHTIFVRISQSARDEIVAKFNTWFEINCTGCWAPTMGGYRFQNDRDLFMFKIFFSEFII